MNITVRHMLGGDIYVISTPNGQDIPTIASIRKQLYDHYIGENGRNEIITLFDEDGIVLNDNTPIRDDEKNNEIILNMFIDHEKKMTNSETFKVEQSLRAFIDNNGASNHFEKFRDAIISAKAVVAGGSILASFGDFVINDLDIYVNFSNGEMLLNKLKEIGYRMPSYREPEQASQYDDSFFRKNNIMARFYLLPENRHHYYRNKNSIDVMIIPDGYDLENVVTNFDLSFCEVWWDGTATYASDPYGVRNKSGMLKPDYRRALFTDFNPFISKRIRKYRSRGYFVDTHLREFQAVYNDGHNELGKLEPIQEKTHKIYDEKQWANGLIKKFLYSELKSFMRPLRVEDASQFSPHTIYFTLAELDIRTRIGEEKMNVLISLAYHSDVIYRNTEYREMYKRAFDIDHFAEENDEMRDTMIEIMISLMEKELMDPTHLEIVLSTYNQYR